MPMNPNPVISINANVHSTIGKVWKTWTNPAHVKQWNQASQDWHTTQAENNLEVGGKFCYRMEAKDGSFAFDFCGIYDIIDFQKQISYTMGDGRKANIYFEVLENGISITEKFEAESENPIEMQEMGWQAILNNFKKYTESI